MKRRQAHLISLALSLLLTGVAAAQSTYRWIDPASGRTVYSDKAPPAGAKNIAEQRGDASHGPASNLPYALQRTSSAHPVTLYTSANCVAECKEARDFLKQRSIPFREEEVSTASAIEALKKRFDGKAEVPALTIGQQQTTGFEANAWGRLLEQAGYPAKR